MRRMSAKGWVIASALFYFAAGGGLPGPDAAASHHVDAPCHGPFCVHHDDARLDPLNQGLEDLEHTIGPQDLTDMYNDLVSRFNRLIIMYRELIEQNHGLRVEYNDLLHKYSDAQGRLDAIEACMCSAETREEAQACLYQ